MAAWQANPGMLNATVALDVIFCVGLIPATYAVTEVAWRRAPRLTTAGGFLFLFGFLVGIGLLGGPLNLEVMTARYGPDPRRSRQSLTPGRTICSSASAC